MPIHVPDSFFRDQMMFGNASFSWNMKQKIKSKVVNLNLNWQLGCPLRRGSAQLKTPHWHTQHVQQAQTLLKKGQQLAVHSGL